MNNLYEFGSVCDVVIRCNSVRTIGNKTYAANEPYTMLKDVYCSLGYRSNNSSAEAKQNIGASRDGIIDSITISNIELTEKLCNLIAIKKQEKTTKGIYYLGVAEDGKIFLPSTPCDDNIFVYDEESNKIENVIYQDGCLIGAFNNYQNYNIFYNVLISNSFSFEVPTYGYFSLEIYGKGNNDKKTDDIYIKIPAASLVSIPNFDFTSGQVLNVPLQFVCIHHRQEQPYFNIGD